MITIRNRFVILITDEELLYFLHIEKITKAKIRFILSYRLLSDPSIF